MNNKHNALEPVGALLISLERSPYWLHRHTNIPYGKILSSVKGERSWRLNELGEIAKFLRVDVVTLIGDDHRGVAS